MVIGAPPGRTAARCTPPANGRPGARRAPGSNSALPRPDPYSVLGVPPGVSDEELRAAYRRLVQLHHPDHNNGSLESARRFEEVQDAYAAITRERRRHPTPPRSAPPPPPSTPDVEQRLADLERELREKARAAREAAQRAAREAAAAAASKAKRSDRPSDEELGYIKTDDSVGKIVADGLDEFADWLKRHDHRGDSD